jgi:hypothetical protein
MESNHSGAIMTTIPTQLFQVFNTQNEMLAFAAQVEFYGDGTMRFFTGSVSGPCESVEPTSVGTLFDHWQYGRCRVIKINRKTIKLEKLPSGEFETIRHTL